jgi:hypothetical protein
MSTNDTISFEAFREQWLEDVRAGKPSTVELGHRFAYKLLTQWREISDPSDDVIYCDGAGDGGIDVAYLDRSQPGDGDNGATGDTWYLVQSKYGSAFQGVGTLLIESQKVIETLAGQRQAHHRLSSLTEDLIGRLNTFRRSASVEHGDRIVLVFATEDPLTDEQRSVLTSIRAMGRDRLGPIFDAEAFSVETIYLRTLDELPAGVTAKLRVPIHGKLVASGDKLLVGSVSLLSLYAFLKAYRVQTEDLDQLYEKNVRRFLGSRGRVNRAMQQTLQETPDRFGLYNNGITIVVSDFAHRDGDVYELSDPYVVNGCQTKRTIWEVFHQRLEAGGHGPNPELETWRHQASHGVVVAKIVKVVTGSESLLQAITRYTNSQNAVSDKDFLTLESDFQRWARQMAERYQIFLEVQRGGWDSQRALQKQNPNLPQFKKAANAFDLLKVYGAGWLQEAGTAFGRNAAFVPGGSVFKRITVPSDEPFGVDDLYAAYRLQDAADAYEFGRNSPKRSRRQTRYLYYLVVIDLLKEVLVRAGVEATPANYTRALLKLFAPGNEQAITTLLDTAAEVIDSYLTEGTDDSIFLEPTYRATNDLHSYLKGEQLGKTPEASPHLRSLIAGYRKAMSMGGKASVREQISSVIQAA